MMVSSNLRVRRSLQLVLEAEDQVMLFVCEFNLQFKNDCSLS